MELVTCRSCGGQIADQYRECPQCGQPMPARATEGQQGGEGVNAELQRGFAEGRLRTCPDCNAPVSVSLASCHRCGHPFAGADWHDQTGWDAAYHGLRLYRYGLITYVITVFASYVLLVMAAVASSPTLAITLMLGAGIALLVGHGMMVRGQHQFASIPPESGAKGLAWAGFVGGLLALSLALVGLLLALSGAAKASVSAVSGVGSIAWVVGSICFILAMAGVARHVDSPQLGRQATVVLVLLVVFLALGIGYEYLAYRIKVAAAVAPYSTRVQDLRGIAVLVLIPWAAVGLFYLLKFLQLLATLTAILGEASTDANLDDEDLDDEDLDH